MPKSAMRSRISRSSRLRVDASVYYWVVLMARCRSFCECFWEDGRNVSVLGQHRRIGILLNCTDANFADLNAGKANFNDIYVQSDPRSYFRVLGGLHYMIPDVAHPVFDQVIVHLTERLNRPPIVLDIGCSYGVNAALLKYDIGTEDLHLRYADSGLTKCASNELIVYDRNFFASWPKRHDLKIIGLDVSRAATDYALKVGLIDEAINIDLENAQATAADLAIISKADLIISTGCIGYVTERTFLRILDAFGGKPLPWIASFVLRMFPFTAIDEALATRGFASEKLTGATFVQRRFRDRTEADEVLSALAHLGVDPDGKESQGVYHAEFFLSRPTGLSDHTPVEQIVSIASGVGRLKRPLRAESGYPGLPNDC